MAVTSPWECGSCSMSESPTRRINRVCHHCGKLLCRKCSIEFLDGAFGGAVTAFSHRAYHCDECRDAHHGRIRL